MAKTVNVKENAAGSNKRSKIMLVEKKKAEKIIFARFLIILFVDIVVASLFEFVKAEATRELFFHENVLPLLKYVFIAALVLSVAYLVFIVLRKIDATADIMTPEMIVAAALYCTATVCLYDAFRISPILFYTVTVIASVMFVVYYVYTVLLYRK